ncbi:MAG TPA: HAMP domain-containing sensor histidine kinase [Candidatus Dormibacteraeota bacterium]|nr:HAMP domain-containing sensor histidine kinase [Candidatus Dormibacteraeota bacterium]
MTVAVTIARDLTAVAFVALGAAIAYRWYRERGHAQGVLALALISLAAVAALGRFQERPAAIVSIASIVLFMLSGYFVLLFRNEFIPLGSASLQAANVLLGVSIVVGVLLVTVLAQAAPPVRTALTLEIVCAWAIFTGEPIVRFWLASNRLPAVQKARLRFLSFGFAVLIAILLVAVLGGSALQSPAAIIVIQILALAAVPAIYVSLAPPSLLRRIWRLGEEVAVRGAMQDLLIFSPNREVLAERAVFWAVRLVGARSGFIVDAGGDVIATTGIDRDEAAALAATGDAVVRAPLHLPEGQGYLAVIAGTFTPVFGTDEIAQLNAYADSVSAGLQRARVTERMAQIEKNKSEFLNLASHELRGPITVIRGYVSMLQSGLLGHLNEGGQKAANVMAAKVLEMNEVIEEMIESARLEEGGVTVRRVETDMRTVAREAADIVAPLMEAKHHLVMDLPDRRVRVNLDPERTKTIIANLLSNAIKYSPNGGDITCQVRSRNGIAKVAVTDQGLGIAQDDLGTLFTRFGRVITPETEHMKGTGLGLFLGRQLARLQGGDIAVISVRGKGSTFTLQLPTDTAVDDSGGSVGADAPPA